MKKVPIFANKSNHECYQACIKMVVDYFFPQNEYSYEDIQINTHYIKNIFTWVCAGANWLNNIGLKVNLFSSFPYDNFSESYDPMEFMRQQRSIEQFELEKNRGDYQNLTEIKIDAKKMCAKAIFIKNKLTNNFLEGCLNSKKYLAIGKTKYGLAHNTNDFTDHFVIIVNSFSSLEWNIICPGPPEAQYLTMPKMLTGLDFLFGDLLLIKTN